MHLLQKKNSPTWYKEWISESFVLYSLKYKSEDVCALKYVLKFFSYSKISEGIWDDFNSIKMLLIFKGLSKV